MDTNATLCAAVTGSQLSDSHAASRNFHAPKSLRLSIQAGFRGVGKMKKYKDTPSSHLLHLYVPLRVV